MMTCLEDRRGSLTASDLEAYADLTDRFESAWLDRPEDPPDPSGYLPSPPIEPLSGLVLVQILKVDLEYRAARGALPTPEAMLARFPSLRGDPEGLVEVLAWGSRIDDSTSDGVRSGFDMASLAEKFPEVKDDVVRCRAILYRELDGKLSADLVPDGCSLIGEMKSGGMSRVALIWNPAGGRQEVLKLNDPPSGDRVEAVRRFKDEIRIASKLTVEVVPVYSSGTIGGFLYYTMPYLRGGSLKDRLDSGQLPIREGVIVLRDIARAVERLHAYETDDRPTPIVHRDLKPANILFPGKGNAEPKIADLGLAKLLDGSAEPADPKSVTGQTLGTPGYMAPEQIFAVPGGIGPAADIHALGVMLYEVLTGVTPFRAPTAHATLIRTIHDVPTSPRQVAPGRAPLDLGAVALKALKKLPTDRYESAAAFAADLDRWLDGKPVLAREPNLVERAWSTARRYPVAASLAALFVLSLMVGTVTSTTLWLRASQQKARADKNALRRAASLGGLVNQVGDALGKAGLSKQRSVILGKIAADLHEVVDDNDGVGSVELGNALIHESSALYLIGKTKEALAATERAGQVFGSIPESYESLAGQAASLQQSGRLLAALNQFPAGRERTERAIALFDRLIEQRPDDAETRFRFARTLMNSGNFLKASDLEGAARRHGESLDQLAFLRRSSQDAPEYVEWDARTRSNLGLILTLLGRHDQAIGRQTEAVGIAERLVADYPDEITPLDTLAATRNNLGEALGPAGRADEAEAAFRTAVGPYQTLANRVPGEPDYRWGVAMVLTNIAAILNQRGSWNDAIPLLVQAGGVLKNLEQKLSLDPAFRETVDAQQKLLAEARTAVASKAGKP